MIDAILVAATLIAQTAKSGDIHVTMVNDRRGQHFNRLSVTVELPTIKLSDVDSSRVLLKSAVDDAGTNLIKSDSGEPELETNSRRNFGDPNRPPQPMEVSIEMSNPPRTAKMLKELRGDIELYMPARDANGTATIKSFMSQSGKSLNDRALKANNVDFTLVSDAQFETMRKAAEDKYRAEEKAKGVEGDDLEQRVKDWNEYEYIKPDAGDVLVKVNDPNKRLQSVQYVAANGETTQVQMREKQGLVILSTYGPKPPADTTMRINLKTSKNVVRYPFALTNIPLP